MISGIIKVSANVYQPRSQASADYTGLGREGTELRVLHTTREAESTMPVTARPVRLEQGVKHSGIVTSEAEAY